MQSVIELNLEMASENTYNPGRRNILVNYKSDQESLKLHQTNETVIKN